MKIILLIFLLMDFARVYPCMVCKNKHLISARDKKKKKMNLTDENIEILKDLLAHPCLTKASSSQHFLTTRLQYRTLKFLGAIYTILRKLFIKLNLHPTYKLPDMDGPLKCYERSQLFIDLCQNIIKHSYILGEHFLEIDTGNNSWRELNDEPIYLLHRINKSLWTYGLTYHLRKCYECQSKQE